MGKNFRKHELKYNDAGPIVEKYNIIIIIISVSVFDKSGRKV